jgi:adenine-specific DNA methylase
LDFGNAPDDQAEPATPRPILPPDPLRNSRNFRLNDDVASHIAEGGSKARLQHNLDILELLKTIQAEQRTATTDEQNRIAQYIDFGGLRELWDQGYRYYEERNRLAEILSEDEIDAVKETSLNTHYTAIEVVDQMWAAANRLGFAGGRILEPGMGVGNFFARIPDSLLHESELFGVEKNPLSGALASMPYPDAKILVRPFEDTRLPNNSFDLIIGNPPFADIKIADPEYSDPKLSLHNYFLVKSLDKLKPGGIAVCISSHYTLDSLDVRPRRALAARADLIAAIRLPEDAFKKNANTSVTTDILFFRKRLPNEPQPEHPVWIDSVSHIIPGYGDSSAVSYNAYFDEHPEMVLGIHSAESRMYGRKDYTLKPFEGDTSLVERLQEAIETLPENVATPYDPSLSQGSRINRSASSLVPAPNTIKNHSYFLDEGTVWFNDNGARTPLPRALSSGRILFQLKSLIALRDTLKEVIRLQLQPSDEGQLAECQEQLLRHYESYRANFGPLNNIGTAKLFEDDPEYPLLTALENIDPETSRISLADIFTKRTIRPYEPLRELPSDPKAAMLQVLAECGRLDTGLMSRLLDKPEAEVVAQLVAADLIYKEPNSQQYQTADEYLSGNVRQKLKDAQGATLLDPAYERNVKALEAIQPEIVPFIDIDVRLGQTWVPTEVYVQFLNRHMAEQRPASGDRAPSITTPSN